MISEKTREIGTALLNALKRIDAEWWIVDDLDSDYLRLRDRDGLVISVHHDDYKRRFVFEANYGDLDQYRIKEGSRAERLPSATMADDRDRARIYGEVLKRVITPARAFRDELLARQQNELWQIRVCDENAHRLAEAAGGYATVIDPFRITTTNKGEKDVHFSCRGVVTFNVRVTPHLSTCSITNLIVPLGMMEYIMRAAAGWADDQPNREA